MTTHGISNNDDGIVAGSPVVPMTNTRPGGGVATAPHPGFDVDRARRDTPGTRMVVHLNNAGAALPPVPVTDAVITHLRRESEIGGYEAAAAAADQVEHTYTAIARLIGCRVDEVAVVENATRAWDMAFYALNFAPGERILTTRAEYASNVIAFLQVAARTGAVVEVIDNDEIRAALDRRPAESPEPRQRTGQARCDHACSDPGRAGQPCRRGRRRDPGSRSAVPARRLPIGRTNARRCRKDRLRHALRDRTQVLRGPRGTGFLYIRRSMLDQLDPPFLDLHAATWTAPNTFVIRPDARRFENWETNYASKIGLGVAVDYALTWGLEAIQARVTGLARRLRETLSNLDGVQVHDQGLRQCGIVSFTIDGIPAATVRQHLHDHGVNVSVSLVDYARLDLPHRGLPTLAQQAAYDRPSQMRIVKLIGPADPSAS